MPNDAQVKADIKADITWFKAHETLILGLCLLCTVLWLGNKWLDNSAVAAKTALGIQQAENAKVQTAADLSAKNYQATIDALSKQNSALAATVAQRQTVTDTKVKDVLDVKGVSAVLSDLAAAYTEINFDPTPVTGNLLSFPLPTVQRFTATKIERDAALADKADLQVVIKNDKTELAAADDVIKTKDALLISNDKTCQAQITSVKADANKAKKKYLIIGGVIALIVRGFIAGKI